MRGAPALGVDRVGDGIRVAAGNDERRRADFQVGLVEDALELALKGPVAAEMQAAVVVGAFGRALRLGPVDSGDALVPVRREVPLAEGTVPQGRAFLAEKAAADRAAVSAQRLRP